MPAHRHERAHTHAHTQTHQRGKEERPKFIVLPLFSFSFSFCFCFCFCLGACSYDEILKAPHVEDSDDEEDIDKADDFESKYNFRFEEVRNTPEQQYAENVCFACMHVCVVIQKGYWACCLCMHVFQVYTACIQYFVS